VPGTGKEGRILKEDVLHYIEQMKTTGTPGSVSPILKSDQKQNIILWLERKTLNLLQVLNLYF
jgi:hypothetical protein